MGFTINTNFLLLSMLWGTIGLGFLVYGRKQAQTMRTVCGIVLIVASFIPSGWIMSAVAIGAIAGTTWLAKRGF
jgi:predicted phage tail protein